jgi:hypothetical protein
MNAIAVLVLFSLAQENVNHDSAVIADFEARVADYVKLRKKVRGDAVLKPTTSPEVILQRQTELAKKIREGRPDAAQGAIFTPPVAAEFRRLIGLTMQGPEAHRIRKSLRDAEPTRAPIQVNGQYPSYLPLQSTPPTLLLNLPPLPPELDYRIVGRDLVLRDTEANLIVDILPQAIPLSPKRK